MNERVLLTGISGYIGQHVGAELLRQGYEVVGTVRSNAKATKAAEAIARVAPTKALSFVKAQLLSDSGWDEAMKGCNYVIHVASPFVLSEPKDESDLIVPAVEGTKRVVSAAKRAGGKRLFVSPTPPGTGALVSVDTVREQLFYEMGNPHAYITPDVVADFATITLRQDGPDRVRVTGVKGYEPTPLYKVSMAYSDGFKSLGAIAISGPDARAKAEAFSEIFWERCGRDDFTETSTEYFGWNACHRSLGGRDDGNEILLRLGARCADEKKLRRFGKLIPSLILSGPPGVCVIGGVPKAHEIVSYWPALMPKSVVRPKIALCEIDKGIHSEVVVPPEQSGKFDAAKFPPEQAASKTSCDIKFAMKTQEHPEAHPLSTICLGRSGDKGDMANIGIMARSPEAFTFLERYLTAQRVKDLFQELCAGPVTRYRLPNMLGLNFLLDEALGGGGTVTLRTDAQGKTFAQALLRHRTLIPREVIDSVTSAGE